MFFLSLKLQCCQTIVLLNILKLFKRNLFFESDDGHGVSRQQKRRLPKSTVRFFAKKRWHSAPPVGLSWDSPPPPPESVRAYAGVTTKISRIDRLPNLLSNGTPLAGLPAGSAIKFSTFAFAQFYLILPYHREMM